MARSGNIVFWQAFNDRVLDSFLDNLPGRLGFPGDSRHHLGRILSYSLFLVFIPIFILAFSRPRKERDIHTRAALRALLTIVAPTCSLWPSRYIKLASIRHSHVNIPLEMVIEDTTDGIIEFRDPVNDLADLIGSGTTVNGHKICIYIAWKWWVNCFEWWMLTKSKSDYPTPCSSGYVDCLNSNMPTGNSILTSLPLSSFALTSSTPYHPFCLDHLPYDTVPSLNADCKVSLEFTAFSPSLRMLSSAQIFSAIPFIISERSPRRPRTLVSVLKQLSAAYGPKLAVDTVSNVSVDYERKLRHIYQTSFREQKLREMWVKGLGIKAWRRDMFLVALEVALLRRGWVERWAIQVTVK